MSILQGICRRLETVNTGIENNSYRFDLSRFQYMVDQEMAHIYRSSYVKVFSFFYRPLFFLITSFVLETRRATLLLYFIFYHFKTLKYHWILTTVSKSIVKWFTTGFVPLLKAPTVQL